MENLKEQSPNNEQNKTEKPSVAIPQERPTQKNLESEIKVPHKPEILKPTEEGENWNEKLPKEGYDPEYPAMPTSSGTLL
jgi:hypothetical protein